MTGFSLERFAYCDGKIHAKKAERINAYLYHLSLFEYTLHIAKHIDHTNVNPINIAIGVVPMPSSIISNKFVTNIKITISLIKIKRPLVFFCLFSTFLSLFLRGLFLELVIFLETWSFFSILNVSIFFLMFSVLLFVVHFVRLIGSFQFQ